MPPRTAPDVPASASSRLFPWRIERPVFIIAPPRSGSTFLFECLVQFAELSAFTDREGTFLWRRVLPYDKRISVSDAISPEEFGPRRRQQLKALLYGRTVLKAPGRRPAQRLVRLVRQPAMRYLDKSIANTFRLPLLAEMFPDATFVYLVRDPRANIASMIEGWSWEGFGKPTLTRYLEEAGSPLPHWTFAAPPGWREVLHRSVPEVCAWSWQQHVEAILDFRESTATGPLIRYEDLTSDPLRVVRELAAQLGLEVTDEIAEYLAVPPRSRTTLTRQGSEEVRDTVAWQVSEVLPRVSGTAARLGY